MAAVTHYKASHGIRIRSPTAEPLIARCARDVRELNGSRLGRPDDLRNTRWSIFLLVLVLPKRTFCFARSSVSGPFLDSMNTHATSCNWQNCSERCKTMRNGPRTVGPQWSCAFSYQCVSIQTNWYLTQKKNLCTSSAALACCFVSESTREKDYEERLPASIFKDRPSSPHRVVIQMYLNGHRHHG